MVNAFLAACALAACVWRAVWRTLKDRRTINVAAKTSRGLVEFGPARLLLVACALSACGYDLTVENCTIVCAADEMRCPDGFTCGPEGLCRSDTATECALPSDGTGGTITHVGGRSIHTFSANQSGSTFTPPMDVSSVELLVVAGGGGGGSTRGGGGGGAGGLIHAASFAVEQPSYVVMVGYGGASGTKGGDSTFGTAVAVGGGSGQISSATSGGSGGGADHGGSPNGSGTSGQGNRGGSPGFENGPLTVFTGAGGGGAGAVGAAAAPSAGGNGGHGLAYTISGIEVFYAGGGGGGSQDLGDHGLTQSSGGNGGGGAGGLDAIGEDAIDGTGGGGGGGGDFRNGGRGGNGVVIVSYPTSR